jgi:hypothetical protein
MDQNRFINIDLKAKQTRHVFTKRDKMAGSDIWSQFTKPQLYDQKLTQIIEYRSPKKDNCKAMLNYAQEPSIEPYFFCFNLCHP